MRRRLGKAERGQSVVELALTLPIVLLILLGMVDFSRMYQAYLTVQHAAREGARLAITGATDSSITQRVYDTAPTLTQSNITVQVTPAAASRISGGNVTVQVTYPYSVLTPIVSNIVGKTLNLNFAITFRME